MSGGILTPFTIWASYRPTLSTSTVAKVVRDMQAGALPISSNFVVLVIVHFLQ